ncbi:MAG: DUF2256 domain-containing protein [Chitinophagaceae bacterium]|nr:DUF2256 domain-containing protein [Chitinophagaceae bacterium]
MKNIKKSDLPFKVCKVCQKKYNWRKKWINNWNEVKYCSEKCKRNKNK